MARLSHLRQTVALPIVKQLRQNLKDVRSELGDFHLEDRLEWREEQRFEVGRRACVDTADRLHQHLRIGQ
jgi:hypothetical protein